MKNEIISKLLENTGDMALKRRARAILEAINPQENDTILDIGCGDGYYLHLLNQFKIPLRLTGTDFDTSGLSRARKNIPRSIPLFEGDLMKRLPFHNNSFDKIIMSEVTEHLPDDIRGLKEVFRVLKKNGQLVLTVPCKEYPFFWDPVNWILDRTTGHHIESGFWAGIWNQHIRLYTLQEIKSKVENAGFTVEESKVLTFWCLPFNHHFVNFIARRLASGTLSENLKRSLSKYTLNPKRPMVLDIAFRLANGIDSLNDVWHPRTIGVGVFITAKK